jgi:hypothetical protein
MFVPDILGVVWFTSPDDAVLFAEPVRLERLRSHEIAPAVVANVFAMLSIPKLSSATLTLATHIWIRRGEYSQEL